MGFQKGNTFGTVNKGKKRKSHSEEWKRKMSERFIGKNNPFFGKKHTEEVKEKIRLVNLGNKNVLGKHWKIKDTSKMSLAKKGKIPKNFNKMIKKYWLGKKRPPISEEQKQKMRISHKKWRDRIGRKTKGERDLAKRKNAELKRNAVGTYTIGEWETLKVQYGFTCPACKRKEPEIKLTIDHIIPLSRGGSNWIENIQPLCMPCNARKQTKIIKYLF